jgi:hypothetical protein
MEKAKIQSILNLISGTNNNYEDAFPILFELCQDQTFYDKGNKIPESKLKEVTAVFQHIAKAQIEVCQIEKWPLPDPKAKITICYLQEYNMYHGSIVSGVMIFIFIVFPGLKRGVLQGYHLTSKRASYSKFILATSDGVVN